jgi:hypothetical protein
MVLGVVKLQFCLVMELQVDTFRDSNNLHNDDSSCTVQI